MAKIQFLLNNRSINAELPSGTTVLDFVRYNQHLVGTKIGCREGDCGACTVLVGEIRDDRLFYQSMTSCLMPLGNAHGKHIVTVEGLNMENLTPVQQAIVDEGGTQCGFCTVGFVVSLSGFTLSQKEHNYENAIAAIDGNICRCTGYKSLERAAAIITKQLAEKDTENSVEWLVEKGFIPDYFLTIKERLEALQSSVIEPSGEGQRVFMGGGTDLFVQRPEEMADSPLYHVFGQPSLTGIEEHKGYCYIGAASTAEDIQASPVMQAIFPNLRAHMKLVSSTPIRNMGTLAGNIVNASPIGDLTAFFLALDSSIVLNHFGQQREIKLRDFYLGYKKLDKATAENVETIYFKIPDKNSYFNFEKVCKRTHLDIASVNSACLVKVEKGVVKEAHLSAGGVAPIPKYLAKSSAALVGKKISPELLKEVELILQEEVAPISDARGTSDYKRLLLRQLFYAHFLTFFPKEIQLAELV